MPISSTKNRHHTLVITFGEDVVTGVMLEKDWYSASWADGFYHHQRVVRPQGIFHLLNQSREIDHDTLNLWVDATIRGQFRVIDLREYSRQAPASKNGRK